MKVTLTQQDILLCQHIGGLRSLVARAHGVRDAKMSPDAGLLLDQDGFIGEYAFCKAFNLFPDFGLSPRCGSFDCVIERSGREYRVDVKTTRVKSGRLLSTTKGNPDIDIYVLAVLEGFDVHFPGYAFAADLIHQDNIVDLGHGSGYAMTQDRLRQWKQEQTLRVA